MDPAIEAILAAERTRSNYVVEIQTAPVRRWCPYPGGLVVGGVAYDFMQLDISEIHETSDGSTGLSCQMRLANVDNIVSWLVNDPAASGAAVKIGKVWFDPSISDEEWSEDSTAAQVGVEPWLEGVLVSPVFDGPDVVVGCEATFERRGRAYRSADVMHSHRPPEPGSKIGYVQIVEGS